MPLILSLDDPKAELATVGGKGASLALLARAGVDVPPAFHVTTAAYRSFVTETGIDHAILEAHALPPSEAALQIARLFADAELPERIATAIAKSYAALGGGQLSVAVRSSATAEDLPGMSFAGQQESFLNIVGEDAVIDAVRRCWASLWTDRAIEYRRRNGIEPSDVALAVVVQQLVEADASGVLFTIDPVTGSAGEVVVNASWGLGESIVGGTVTPDTFVVDKATGTIARSQVNDKERMTVLASAGTSEIAVPKARRQRPSISHEIAIRLARIATDIEAMFDLPVDVEWAVASGRTYILQARPVTGLGDGDIVEEWNDSLRGDFLWTSGNLGEAVPDVMTPCTWSLVRRFMRDVGADMTIGGYSMAGNIGGRFYMNLSVIESVSAAFGMQKKAAAGMEQAFGKLPQGMTVPLAPVSRWQIVRELIGTQLSAQRRARRDHPRIDAFVAASPERCKRVRGSVQNAGDAGELSTLWATEVEPYFSEACAMMASARAGASRLVTTEAKLRAIVRDGDASALLSGGSGDGRLASLDLLIGLHDLSTGAIDRDTFAMRYGHRGPHEFEVSMPRPAEDSAWIDAELKRLTTTSTDVTELVERSERARAEASTRLEATQPRKVATVRRLVDRWAASAREREITRSEVIRAFWAVRTFVQRAGELMGCGDDIWFLSIDEVLAHLDGDDAVLRAVAPRRAAHARYSRLPAYPTFIRGPFDPFRWAADPDRRTDAFDASGAGAHAGDAIRGFPGAAGVVEGVARVIPTIDDGDALGDGEILVTTVTNVGWTPLFPRAAAVVTDVGAPLSHAAIVARELGIPAVVGCGNATTKIKSGDRIRVDGERGTVEVLEG